MRIALASSAELYAEHRQTASPRKRAKIAAELQRRHDELNCPAIGGGYYDDLYHSIQRFDFVLWLP